MAGVVSFTDLKLQMNPVYRDLCT